MVGFYVAFICSDEILDVVVGLVWDLGVGVHVYVVEGVFDWGAGVWFVLYVDLLWLFVYCVYFDCFLFGTIVYNLCFNMNNVVGYVWLVECVNLVVLGIDGIGVDMLEEFCFVYVWLREHDVIALFEVFWVWFEHGRVLFFEIVYDWVMWIYDYVDDLWWLVFIFGVWVIDVVWVDGEILVWEGCFTRVDLDEVRVWLVE